MAKAPASDSIMAPDKMKPLLALSKREPVQAAIGLTADGDGIVLLDKKAKPRKVASMLRASAAKAKLQINGASIRFGRAEVDPEYDSGMVRFFINKDAPGNMRVKLVELIKRVPYQKVELNVDPSLEAEPEDGQDADPAEAPSATAEGLEQPPAPGGIATPNAADLARILTQLAGRIAQVAGTDGGARARLAKRAGEANGLLKAGDLAGAAAALSALREALDAPVAPTDPPIDPAALRKDLAGLVGRIVQAAGDDPGRRAALAKLANDANTALKDGNLPDAAALIGQLREALTGSASTDDPTAPLRARLEICQDDLKRIRDAAARETVANAIGDIEAQLREGKTGPAASMIDVLETQIGEALRAAREDQVEAEAGHMVEFAKLQLRWRDAQAAFEANLNAIGDALLARPDVQADPRFDVLKQAVAAFPVLVPKFGGDLEDALDAGMSATAPADKARHAAAASAAIDAYRQQVSAAAGLAEIQQFAARDLGANLPLKDALDLTLAELKQALTARG